MTFTDPDLIYDDVATAEAGLAGVAERIPEWEPAEGHVETSLAESIAVAIATAAVVFRDELRTVYADGLGEQVLGVPRRRATAATTLSTWTFDSTDPVTVPGGTEVQALAGDTTVFLVTAEDVSKPGGTLTLGGVELIALEPGTASNGASGAGRTDRVDVDTVILDAPTGGGTDEEEPEDYRARLAPRMRRLRTLPITPEDHAAWATDTPGVGRAWAINRYDPDNPADDALGHTTIFATDPAGADLNGTVTTAVEESFTGIDRPLPATIHILPPPRVTVVAVVEITAKPDADRTALEAEARAAILAAASPANFDGDATREGNWVKSPSAHLSAFQISAAIDDLPDLRSVDTITLNGGATVALPGPLSLPQLAPGDLTVSVTA